MTSKTVIVDYQLGNLFSVKRACEATGIDAFISSSADDLLRADCAILPGVGAFPDAMKSLQRLKLDEAIRRFAGEGKPLFGICLGMQLMFDSSDEFGNCKGLALVAGCVRKLPIQTLGQIRYKVPHIGWASIEPIGGLFTSESPLRDLKSDSEMYFVHSFFVDASVSTATGTSTYGEHTFCSTIKCNNLFATQFHPEKSGEVGLSIYRNWHESR